MKIPIYLCETSITVIASITGVINLNENLNINISPSSAEIVFNF